jgi:hypothetical protein
MSSRKIAQIVPEMRFTPRLWQGNTESIRAAFILSLKEWDFPPLKLNRPFKSNLNDFLCKAADTVYYLSVHWLS